MVFQLQTSAFEDFPEHSCFILQYQNSIKTKIKDFNSIWTRMLFNTGLKMWLKDLQSINLQFHIFHVTLRKSYGIYSLNIIHSLVLFNKKAINYMISPDSLHSPCYLVSWCCRFAWWAQIWLQQYLTKQKKTQFSISSKNGQLTNRNRK